MNINRIIIRIRLNLGVFIIQFVYSFYFYDSHRIDSCYAYINKLRPKFELTNGTLAQQEF
ncbi:hypothetical protein [Mucilaginibacter jinjuensis]|uniref:Uncharacterized protein n=1 Tax=Mucilaginibacter jinjuensis TaxID=1176721 RepID=A0ABY7TAX1_9SPHI|nr:hypothetical protein [Mucilaginibacter jinjuensis]WCT13384.1 hypothetical protein PQO05_05480 [Mucilaginibacter jinjuensis]